MPISASNYDGTQSYNVAEMGDLCKPNILVNSDFKINQRGATSYEKQGYSVDRWKIWNVTVTPSTSGGITVKNDKYTDTGTFVQPLENATEGDSTLSCYVTSVSGKVTMVADDDSQVILKQGLNVVHTNKSTKNFIIFLNLGTSVTLKWVKLEQGTVATEFIAPNPAEELVKCERYYEKRNWNTKQATIINNILCVLDEVKEKRVKPTVKHSGNTNVYYNGSAYPIGTRGFEVVTKNQTRFEFNVGVSLGSGNIGTAFLYDINTEIDAEIY